MSPLERQPPAGDDSLAQVIERDRMPFGDLTGSTLGDFQVERLLGRGGMGEVYLATQVSLNRPVALKVLRPDVLAKPGYRERFESEAIAVAKLNHPSIVHVYAMGQIDGVHFIAMEYVEGTNLREYVVKRGALDLPQALSIMKQAAQAIGAAGEAGIIHRDVKPENILMTRRGRVKVADFGLCRQVDEEGPHLTQVGITMGTPAYMSPEQAQGYPLDHRSDLYSLGATIYFMLAAMPPFKADSPVAMALKQVREIPSSLLIHRPDLPVEIDRLVMKLMAKNPADRYQSAAEMLGDLAKVREAIQVSTGGSAGAMDTLDGATARTEEIGTAATFPVPAVRTREPGRRPRPDGFSRSPSAVADGVDRRPGRDALTSPAPRFSGLIATAAVAIGLGCRRDGRPDRPGPGDPVRAPDDFVATPSVASGSSPDGPRSPIRAARRASTDMRQHTALAATSGRPAGSPSLGITLARTRRPRRLAVQLVRRLWYRRDDVERPGDALAAGTSRPGSNGQRRDKDLAALIRLALDLKKGDLGAVEKAFARLSEAEVADMYDASLVAFNLEVCADALKAVQKSGTQTIEEPLRAAPCVGWCWSLNRIEIGGPAGAGRAVNGAAAAPRSNG